MPNPLKLKALLIDLNGTLHVGRDALPGAARAVERLRAARIPFVFCSNSTKESDGHLLAKLRDMGIAAEPRELLTSIGACRQLVAERQLRPYLVMSPEAATEFPAAAPPYDAVILGLHEPSLTYANLNTAFRVLAREPLPFPPAAGPPVLIAPHRSSFQHAGDAPGMPAGLSLGIGPFVAALESATGVSAEVVGKPSRRFFEMALARLDVGADDVAVVGDDVVNDLGEGARALGLRRVLVRTGKYRQGAEDEHAPDAVYDSFAAFVDDLV